MSSQSKTDGSNALKERRIIVIEATQKQEQKKLRVAGYARVSSDSSDQLNSFAAQNTYFTKLIESNDQWEMIDVYADEGISGRSAEKRGDFQRMIADCERGKIDRIITKSISRFARNAKECLTIIRHLKSIGVSIYFEEQNIDTSIVTGEMLTAVFAGLAQAESESIAKNMRWSYEKRMASGEFNTCKSPLGYRMVKGQLEVDEDEAAIVRMIFRDYLSGKSCEAIGAKLREMGVQSRDKKNAWGVSTVTYILTNERYIGNALLQKKYTTESFPPQKKRNRGERPQYYVEDSNPPIIDEETLESILGDYAGFLPMLTGDFPLVLSIKDTLSYTYDSKKNPYYMMLSEGPMAKSLSINNPLTEHNSGVVDFNLSATIPILNIELPLSQSVPISFDNSWAYNYNEKGFPTCIIESEGAAKDIRYME